MATRFTGLRAINHDGSPLQGHGITPDVVVHPTVEGITAGRDEILEAAIQLASGDRDGRQP
jgi:C-terminal processing protease CtpA/Prc